MDINGKESEIQIVDARFTVVKAKDGTICVVHNRSEEYAGVKESLKELGLINLIRENVTEITEAKINACSQDTERQRKIAFDPTL